MSAVYEPCVENTKHVVEADVDVKTRTTGVNHLDDWYCSVCHGLHVRKALMLHHATEQVGDLSLLL